MESQRKFQKNSTVYNFDTTDVDGKPEVHFKCLKRLVGERGFEPPTPWSRTRCSTRLSHSPTEVSPFILLHVTSNVPCSENPETWDHWDHPPARTVLEPAPFADEMHRRSACIRTWFSGSSVLLARAGDLPASRWPGA